MNSGFRELMFLGASLIEQKELILREGKHINKGKFPAKTFVENKRCYGTISGPFTMLLSSFSKWLSLNVENF